MLVGMWNNRNSYSLLVVIQNGITKHTLKPFSPAVVLLGVYPKELKTYIQPETCTQIFIAALAIIAKTWKQPRCPLVHGWINELCYSGSWWWTGRPGVLRFTGLQRVGHDWVTKLTELTWQPDNGILYNMRKKMGYQAMKIHGETLHAYYWVEEANLKGYILCDSNYMTF